MPPPASPKNAEVLLPPVIRRPEIETSIGLAPMKGLAKATKAGKPSSALTASRLAPRADDLEVSGRIGGVGIDRGGGEVDRAGKLRGEHDAIVADVRVRLLDCTAQTARRTRNGAIVEVLDLEVVGLRDAGIASSAPSAPVPAVIRLFIPAFLPPAAACEWLDRP
jgi:hypothetical protein